MSILVICLFIAVLLTIISKFPLAYAMSKQGKGYDNHHPRAQQSELTGFGARALGAHQNSFESLIIFATASLAAMATNHVTPLMSQLAVAFIIARIIYHCCYLFDWASLRSLVFTIGYVICLVMLWMCV